MKKKFILGLLTTILLAGIVGCSSNDQSSTAKNMNNNNSQKMSSNKMNMTDEQMKNMKSSKQELAIQGENLMHSRNESTL